MMKKRVEGGEWGALLLMQRIGSEGMVGEREGGGEGGRGVCCAHFLEALRDLRCCDTHAASLLTLFPSLASTSEKQRLPTPLLAPAPSEEGDSSEGSPGLDGRGEHITERREVKPSSCEERAVRG